jgi:hypothetical protein
MTGGRQTKVINRKSKSWDNNAYFYFKDRKKLNVPEKY